jgi:hypothetical protein
VRPCPCPVWGYPRRGPDRGFKPLAAYGPWAAQKLAYSGFTLGLRLTRCGRSPGWPRLPARPPDRQVVDDVGEGWAGLGPADRGFSAAFRQALLADRPGVFVVTAPRQRMTPPQRPPLLQVCARVRKGIATGGSPLTERFAVARLRVPELGHLQPRLIRQVLAPTVGVFLNLQCGRPALDLDGLVTV